MQPDAWIDRQPQDRLEYAAIGIKDVDAGRNASAHLVSENARIRIDQLAMFLLSLIGLSHQQFSDLSNKPP